MFRFQILNACIALRWSWSIRMLQRRPRSKKTQNEIWSIKKSKRLKNKFKKLSAQKNLVKSLNHFCHFYSNWCRKSLCKTFNQKCIKMLLTFNIANLHVLKNISSHFSPLIERGENCVSCLHFEMWIWARNEKDQNI